MGAKTNFDTTDDGHYHGHGSNQVHRDADSSTVSDQVGGDAYNSSLLYRAVQTITSRCDGASEPEATGYNLQDAPLRHGLSLLPPERWTPRQTAAAYKMLYKYRVQLAAAGIRYEDIPVPPSVGARRAPAILQGARPQVTFYPDGGAMVLLSFPYDADMVAELRAAIPESARGFDRVTKRWRIYLDECSIGGLARFVERFDITLPDEIITLVLDRLNEQMASLTDSFASRVMRS